MNISKEMSQAFDKLVKESINDYFDVVRLFEKFGLKAFSNECEIRILFERYDRLLSDSKTSFSEANENQINFRKLTKETEAAMKNAERVIVSFLRKCEEIELAPATPLGVTAF